MKLVEHFNTLLTDVVNLNATRVTQLEDSIEALKSTIRSADWAPKIKRFVPQGSWAHKTVTKPVENKAFDADLLVLIEPVSGWEARDYLTTLRAVFADNATYKDKVRRYSHCVTIEYTGERKIDIAPCLVDRGGVTGFEVCNHTANAFEASEPEQYTAWLIERNGWTGGNGLRKVTRLLKYLRDIKGTFSCPSVLLTTLLGARITWLDSLNTTDFVDLPTALKTITARLDDWLLANPTRPTVCNPVLTSEVLSELWDDAQYTNFRDKVHTYRTWIDDAFAEPDRDESIGKWRRVFGDDFAKSVTIEKAARVSDEARVLVESTALTPPGFVGDSSRCSPGSAAALSRRASTGCRISSGRGGGRPPIPCSRSASSQAATPLGTGSGSTRSLPGRGPCPNTIGYGSRRAPASGRPSPAISRSTGG